MSITDPVELNISGVQQLVGSKMNKIVMGASNQVEGIDGEYEDELTLKLDDSELLNLAKKWTLNYAPYETAIKKRQEANKTYYLGRQKEGSQWATTDGQPIAANLLFEAEETFLPAALSKNPTPVVFCDNTEEGDKISNDVKTMLQYHADTLVLRRKLSLVVRHWSIYFLGIMKHGWDNDIQEITSSVRDPRNFIFDPEGFIDPYGHYQGPLGERITVTANELIELFPKHKAYVTIMCEGKMGTEVTYTEWWTDEYCFYTFKNKILDKNKNPHFNYGKKSEVDEEGNETPGEEGKNHFAKPMKPYTFLSVFSLGEQPHDVTGLIEQNIPNQRRVSRRTEQIDYNLSRANNSTVFSENNFTQETAKQASSGMAKGHPILVPSGGPIADAIHTLPAEGLAPAFFDELEVSKNDLRSIFGTLGLTATPPEPNNLATGIVANEQHDSSRIAGGINDAIEQFADNVFNWWTQLYYVYYNDKHFATIMGQMKAVEYITLSSQDLGRHLVVSVAANSMQPKDEVSIAAEAKELFQLGILDPKTLFTRLNFPDAEAAAEQATLWMVDKMTYMQINFPEIAQKVQQAQQQMMQQQQQSQAGQMQAQQQGAEQQNQIQGAQAQQGLAIKEATTKQALTQKEQEHQQKLKHKEDEHALKLKLASEKPEKKEEKPINKTKK